MPCAEVVGLRTSDKHNPRVDELMKEEVDALVRGGTETRAQEFREKEAPTDGEPTPDGVISSGSEADPRAELTHDELELRHNLARFLEGAIFPASREAIVDNARSRNAPDEIVAYLEELPDASYESFRDVWRALSGDRA